MDVVLSSGRDDTVVLEAPSLFETSKHGSDVHPLVFRLPTEITMLMFLQCVERIRPPIILTHICRRWRQIAVNNASLWTNIYIQTMHGRQTTHLDHFISFLGMQLERTGNLLLDVEWYARSGDGFFVATLQLFREKAPFPRWRTLTVDISGGASEDAPWSPVDAFTNLEYLKVNRGTMNSIICAIDATITSRMKVLDLGERPAYELEWLVSSFAKSLTHVSTFCFKLIPPIVHSLFIPQNVVNLRLETGQQHPFPHMQTYEMRACIFDRRQSIHLGHLTILIVCGPLMIASDCQIFLPALRELKLETIEMDANTKFEAPALDALHFRSFRLDTNVPRLMHTNRSLLQSGYLLSPNTSIIADSYLPSTTLINLLAKSPEVTQATLGFNDWRGAQIVLRRLLGFETETVSRSAEVETLCPRLSELRLDFEWGLSEPSESKEWLLERLKARGQACTTPLLSVYASWEGEGTYVLLTGD